MNPVIGRKKSVAVKSPKHQNPKTPGKISVKNIN
jgi:hypothetical protein